MADAYGDAADEVSLREEQGQLETARRALVTIERFVAPGRMLDVGCWTGSFLVAAQERGWMTRGIEPSLWAVQRAKARGVNVTAGALTGDHFEGSTYRAVILCDVLEHLSDPGAAVETLREMIEPGGVLYLTVPDAGSVLARLMGRRWWSVLPMHVQYFTRSSIIRLLSDRGFQVRSVRTHAKVFSARYYAERLGGYQPQLERAALGVLSSLKWSDRLVGPNFRDRMAVIATR